MQPALRGLYLRQPRYSRFVDVTRLFCLQSKRYGIGGFRSKNDNRGRNRSENVDLADAIIRETFPEIKFKSAFDMLHDLNKRVERMEGKREQR